MEVPDVCDVHSGAVDRSSPASSIKESPANSGRLLRPMSERYRSRRRLVQSSVKRLAKP